EELVKQLGSRDFKARDAAERELATLEESASALRKAATSTDLDVAKRAERILQAHRVREEARMLTRLSGLLKTGELDLLLEQALMRKHWEDSEAFWKLLSGLAGKLLDLEKAQYHTSRIEDLPVPGQPRP